MRVGPVLILLTIVTFSRSVLSANPRAENAALDAIGKAEGDFLAMNYASGAARLDKALRACAPSNCSPGTQAALLRDIGTMEFRAGDKGFATKAFTEALKLQPTIDLNPSYDSPDLRAAWMEVKGGPAPVAPSAPAAPSQAASPPAQPNAAIPPPPTYPQPIGGDFMHVPAAEQKIDTPLPVFIEGGPSGVFHVVLRYKNSEQGDDAEWNHMDLTRMGAGWGGVIPCNQVVGGTLRYYIQAFNKDMDPVGANGDAKSPYQVPIREDLSGSPPHLPNRPPPKACHQAKKAAKEESAPGPEEKDTSAADCPPGMPGCGKAETPGDEEAKNEEDSDETKGGRKKKKRAKDFPRFWIGAGFHYDFMQMPSGNDLCRLQPSGPQVAQPANDKHFYCTDLAGNDFPTRLSGVQNDQLSRGSAGQSGGGIAAGNLRVMLSFDYAVISNLLVGIRGGYAFFTYPGTAAVKDGYAWGQKFYLEGRVTGVFGKDPLAKAGIAPILFIGAGVSPFEAKTSDSAAICLPANPPNPACSPPANQPPAGKPPAPGMNNMNQPTPPAGVPGHPALPVDMWITNGPFFVGLGAGIRYAPVPKVALIGAARLNLSFGTNGLIPTLGPEVDVQVGF